MSNTKKVTISINLEQVLKSIYAESACIALMSDGGSRPPVLSADNHRLLSLFCRNAWLALAWELASIVDTNAFSIPDDDDTDFRMPLLVDTDASASRLRLLAERYLTSSVLADCYAARPAHASRFQKQAAESLSALLLNASAGERRSCWF